VTRTAEGLGLGGAVRAHLGDVSARREGAAGAGQHDGTERAVPGDLAAAGAKRREHRLVERVQRLGAIERQHSHRAAAFD
jgi:hypothetical protein